MFISAFILLVIVELVVYFGLVAKWQKRFRLFYLVPTVAINLALFVQLAFMRTLILDPDWMEASTWVVFLFLCNSVPKLLLSVFVVLHFVFRRLKFLISIGYLCSLFALGVLVYGATIGRNELRVERVEINNKKIPEQFDGFKIALFSDTHIGNLGEENELFEDLVEAINTEKPDVVVQCGDLVNLHSGELTDDIMEIFSGIEAPVYSVLGNHDLAYYIFDTTAVDPSKSRKELVQKQKAMGWHLLDNESEWIYRGGDSILIGGTTFPSNHHHNGFRSDAGKSDLREVMAKATANDFSVVASHSPALFDSLYKDSPRPDLILSGHVHSMQSKITIGDWQWSPAKFLYPNFSGLYTDRGHQLYITDGIGYVIMPVRVGAKPELTIFTLTNQ